MEGSMHMRRMEDGYMHRRMLKNKHMQGNDLDTPTTCSVYTINKCACYGLLFDPHGIGLRQRHIISEIISFGRSPVELVPQD